MHPELIQAIKNKDYEKIAQFLCTEHYSSDSTWVNERVEAAFIEGWKECEKMTKLLEGRENDTSRS